MWVACQAMEMQGLRCKAWAAAFEPWALQLHAGIARQSWCSCALQWHVVLWLLSFVKHALADSQQSFLQALTSDQLNL